MIYRLLKLLLSITVKAFFRRYEVRNIHKVPKDKPLIIVANHPSTFMDPIVIAVAMKREIHFIAKAEAFRSKFAAFLLPRFNMIPVYRKEHDPDLMHKNKDIFNKVYEILEKNGVILIFPEGISLTDRKLKQIKSGAARMALGAELKNDFKLGVEIVPVGLNYSDPHKFQSDLFINIEEPVMVAEFEALARTDSFSASQKLSEVIRQRLENQIVAIEDAEVDKMMLQVEEIYKSGILHELGYSKKISENHYIVTKMISERVHYFLEKDRERVFRVKEMIDDYFRLLNVLNIEDVHLRSSESKYPAWLMLIGHCLYFAIGFPLFLFGLINNFIPWKIPGILARRLSGRIEFIGAISMTSGMLTFLIFYSLQIWLFHLFFNELTLTLIYGIMLPVSGFFAYYYFRRFTLFSKKWKFISLFMKRSRLISELILKREQIIDELEQGRKDYELNMTETGDKIS